MKTTTINLYSINELSPKAKERAFEMLRAGNDYIFLGDELEYQLDEQLKEHSIKGDGEVMYSLGYSQGDGAMFTGSFEWEGWTVTIAHSGRYCHANSKTIVIEKENEDGETILADDKTCEAFNNIYLQICKVLEKAGYAYIDHEDSEEYLIELCNNNDYTLEIKRPPNNSKPIKIESMRLYEIANYLKQNRIHNPIERGVNIKETK